MIEILFLLLVVFGMAGIMPNEGEMKALEHIVNKTAPENLILRLFKNDVTPSDSFSQSLSPPSFTEANFTGYAAITLTGASWGAAASGNPSSIAYAQQIFTSTAGSQSQTIYGYYLQQATSLKIIAAERFSGTSPVIQNNGDTIKVTPTVTLKDDQD